ncbi:hypothetical protein GS429_10420 [Natronorubrum sp. JWXQ-INN-674]|uniref:Halobacterial output domain-containing protein n=1 Tax=Natronorubrum halalkaliphilum TaxID=2691917 RepID=A0A6B0VKV0_9EURY|nr:HalOD1 output domain-containing protein [Natronorubrum halalkaliphilum]MXV62471.1 hypothetical protein [Natronorubrum halalkaliphilum]
MTSGQSTTDSPSEHDRFVYQAEPDQPPSEAVITAIAMQSEADDLTAVADELDPLYNAIDPSALDALFDSSGTHDRSTGAVTFEYADRHVRIDTTGRIELTAEE